MKLYVRGFPLGLIDLNDAAELPWSLRYVGPSLPRDKLAHEKTVRRKKPAHFGRDDRKRRFVLYVYPGLAAWAKL